jgi:hypothetical protein
MILELADGFLKPKTTAVQPRRHTIAGAVGCNRLLAAHAT